MNELANVVNDSQSISTVDSMPGMTGIELLQKTVPIRPHMVRILLTGYTDISTLIEAINCGHVYRYVTKPWNNDDLCVTVMRALDHFEASKARHNLDMTNQRLRARLKEISELATQDEQLLHNPEAGLPASIQDGGQLDLIVSN
jgi:two-component system NtrC family sensor kinase